MLMLLIVLLEVFSLIYLSLLYSGRSPLKILELCILCPIIGIVETFPAFYAITEYHIKNKIHKTKAAQSYDFYVIKK
jgi:beta-1,4-mannosyltransferase